MRVQEKNNKGFNILEIVVVLALVAIITGIAIPNFSSWNKERKTKSAAQNLSLIILIVKTVQYFVYYLILLHLHHDLN